jgi:hypothetical protein
VGEKEKQGSVNEGNRKKTKGPDVLFVSLMESLKIYIDLQC